MPSFTAYRLTRLFGLLWLGGLLGLWALCGPLHAADAQQYGRAWLAEGDSAAAVQSYAELVRQNPFDPVALNNMAVAKAAAGDYQSALELLSRAAKIAPQRQDIRDNLSHLQAWQQQTHSVKLGPDLPATRPHAVGGAGSAIWPEPPPLWPAAVPRSRP
jgi:tetratricopeptide (TPR) repeat protein